MLVLQGDLKPVKERFFFLHTSCEVPFCTFISFANFKQAESEFKKKKRIIIHLQHILRVHFFFINKGGTKKKCRVLNEFMQVTVF